MIPPLPFPLSPAQQQRVEETLACAEKEELDLGDIAKEEEDAQVALELYRVNAERNPTSHYIVLEYAENLGNAGNDELALALFNYCQELDPDDVHTFNERVHALYKLQRYEDMLQLLKLAPPCRDDEDRGQLLYWESTALGCLDRHEEALEPGREAFYLWRDNYWMTFNLGYTCYKLKRYEEAIHYYNETIKLHPRFRTPYFNKACMYSMLGKYQEAYLCLMQVYDLDKAYFKTAPEDEELKGLFDSEFGAELRALCESIPLEAKDSEPDLEEDTSY